MPRARWIGGSCACTRPCSCSSRPTRLDAWRRVWRRIADQQTVHGLVRGRATRLLFDDGRFTTQDVAGRISLMLSRGGDPPQAAAWVEGFLSSSGLILLHHVELLAVIDAWIGSISADVFNEQVPLLRGARSRPSRRPSGGKSASGSRPGWRRRPSQLRRLRISTPCVPRAWCRSCTPFSARRRAGGSS